ncbi:MAG TPA: hypothetical protein VGI58_08305 [Streptosporangiaceae bacterium]
MQLGQVLANRPGRMRMPRPAARLWLGIALLLAAGGIAAAALIGPGAPGRPSVAKLAVHIRTPQPVTSVVSGSPATVSLELTSALFTAAPAVVVAAGDRPAQVSAAVAAATHAHAPLLLAASSGQLSAAARAEARSLRPTAVLAIGLPATTLSAQLPGIKVVTAPAALPRLAAPSGAAAGVLVLVHSGTSPDADIAEASARLAGARVLTMPGYDPRAYPAAIRALAAARPRQVLAIGAAFGPKRILTSRIAVAETGVQLPGGGEVLFPMRRIVALYGNPGTPALGALGQQDLAAAITRAKAVAAQYRTLSHAAVVPGFEIIATVAEGSPGPSGSYSHVTPLAELRPWVRAASRAGFYVILDLQPGRSSLLAQAKIYQSLLRRPNVGLALDPEWKLQPGQLPLHQIGSVSISEVNSVVTWLARLTEQYHLPQKLLELHQFRLSMISGEARLDTRHDDLAIVINMDGQGAPLTKLQTWNAITGAAPRHVFFGWKDFYAKDKPMLGPRQTIRHQPRPVLISYQ